MMAPPMPMPMPMAAPATTGSKAKPTTPYADRPRSAATLCRRKHSDNYRAKCHADSKAPGGRCELVEKCKQFGVGSELWPVDVANGYLTPEKFEAVKLKYGPRSVFEGKDCMNKIMREDAALLATIETCPPRTLRPSPHPSPPAKPRSAPAAVSPPAAVKPKSAAAVKPKSVAAKPKSAAAKPKSVAAKPKSKSAAAKPAK